MGMWVSIAMGVPFIGGWFISGKILNLKSVMTGGTPISGNFQLLPEPSKESHTLFFRTTLWQSHLAINRSYSL